MIFQRFSIKLSFQKILCIYKYAFIRSLVMKRTLIKCMFIWGPAIYCAPNTSRARVQHSCSHFREVMREALIIALPGRRSATNWSPRFVAWPRTDQLLSRLCLYKEGILSHKINLSEVIKYVSIIIITS